MLIKKLATGIAAASVFASMVVPAFAADVTVAGNGKNSENNVVVGTLNVNAVGQSNTTTANTTVFTTSSTGGNKANGNTGNGDTSVMSGDATNTTHVTVTGGDNTATLPDSCGCGTVSDISVVGNGKNSKSNVLVLGGTINLVGQKSTTKANTFVVTTAKTGKNKANDNTGAGDTSVVSGGATNTTHVKVTGGSNTLH